MSLNEQENIVQSISEIMTRDVTVLAPGDTLQQAAQIMRDWNIGAIPVCDGKHLTGMLTDRDIAIRAVAEGKLPSETCVREVVSSEVLWCFEDQTIGEVLQQMGDQQIRRLPVLSRNMELTGMVSLGDLATRQPAQTGSALEDISAPTPSARPSTGKHPDYP